MNEESKIIKEIMSECLDGSVNPWEINAEMDIIDELHLDSIVFIQFIIMIEERFEIIVPEEVLNYSVYSKYDELENMIIGLIGGSQMI